MPAVKTKAELQAQKAKVSVNPPACFSQKFCAWSNQDPLVKYWLTRGDSLQLANSYHELLEEFSSKELRSVGNYTLGRLIGKGSFGKVYLASHKLINGSRVVLKSAKKDDSNLAREIHHHRQFLHPHIARLYEVIVTENLVWLVLEYCPGDELYNYLLRNGAIPYEKSQKVFTQLVGAVAYVHGMSCVHRDLKLENILLDKSENVKLCDFGFTREYEGKASYLQTFCGTICYSAPEMLKGEKYAGEKVDVWSLGIILYALLTGELPFDDDDDMATKHKILSSEPKYPDTMQADAKDLITKLLSKRPLHRPSIADILTSPFLAEHAPQQQAILKLTQPLPFTTTVEKETLDRMRSAGVDIDKVIENVLGQRCDALAGWWALLLEKEERKEKRRERKRKEREVETKSMRRISATSTRLERITAPLKEVDEEGVPANAVEASRSRGRRERRSISTPQLVLPELPRLPEGTALRSPGSPTPPPPIEKDPVRSVNSSRHRPPLPPKERRRSRGSTLQLVYPNPDLLTPPNGNFKERARRRHQHAFINQLASIKHWFIDSAKRAKSPSQKSESSTLKTPQERRSPTEARRSTPKLDHHHRQSNSTPTPTQASHTAHTPRPRIATPQHRSSLSPAPLTPHSSYRRSAGLRGRKSTSSSVSSIRSIHHVNTHSKASSTSSTTNSINSSAMGTKATVIHHRASPHSSVKVLPATPTFSAFPSNIRLVRGAPPNPATYDESFTPGFVFAKRKKTPFRGPMLTIGTPHSPHPSISGGSSARRDSSVGASRSVSAAGRRSGEIIEEEDENFEEVDAFSPVPAEAEETIWEGKWPGAGDKRVLLEATPPTRGGYNHLE